MNTISISELPLATILGDEDVIVLNQGQATKKIEYSTLLSIMSDHVERNTRKVGVGHISFVELSPYELAKRRWLPLNYQIIEIALYPELCEMMWCGSANNATANFWYKCSASGIRNVNGLCMRVADSRGLFWRIAGQNAVFKAANNTPYDGGSIGSFKNDTTRFAPYSFSFTIAAAAGNEILNPYGTTAEQNIAYGKGNISGNYSGKHYLRPNSSDSNEESAPVRISIGAFISY